MPNTVFLTARWEKLLMANYRVDPAILAPYVPAGTELDYWDGHVYVSLVGFLFLDTRVLGTPVPFHRDFEEFNLRFYVRRRDDDGWRRGVVFVKEIVPRRAIAWVANTLYGEHYVALPMGHTIRESAAGLEVAYRWKFRGEWNHLAANAAPEAAFAAPDSEAFFITEHYWGYTRLDARRTSAYQVEHPSWRIYPVRDFDVQVDVAGLYAPAFVPFLEKTPQSVFLAEGSPIVVRRGGRLTG